MDVGAVDAARDLVADDNTTLWAEWRDATRFTYTLQIHS